MKYFGGKFRIAKQLAEFLNSQSAGLTEYYEPFCGDCNVILYITGLPRKASDGSSEMIALWKAMQDGWSPPTVISEEQYRRALNGEYPEHVRAFIGHGCSFGGKYFGGYARKKTGAPRNYAMNAHNSLMKKILLLQDVYFFHADYKDVTPRKALVYCDPPYANTTHAYGSQFTFDTDEFWATMRKWSAPELGNRVFISEYTAPADFHCVLEIQTRTDMKNTANKMIPRVERLFTYTGRMEDNE